MLLNNGKFEVAVCLKIAILILINLFFNTLTIWKTSLHLIIVRLLVK